MTTDRRYVAVAIADHHVLDWFRLAAGWLPERLLVPVVLGLPADAEVLAVDHQFYERRFVFLVAHPSFDEVPEGAPPPVVSRDWYWRWTAVEVAKADEAVFVAGGAP